jgi:hypothetical protein
MSRNSEAVFVRAQLERLLGEHQDLEHLRVHVHGKLAYLESGPEDDPWRHVKFKRDTVHLWRLEMPKRGGRWDKTPYRDTLDELFALVLLSFPWVLTPIVPYPERTSDPEF